MTKQSRIVVAVDDMFFAARIRSTAAALGREVEFVKSLAQLDQQGEIDPPVLIIVDLSSDRIDPLKIVEHVKSRPDLKSVPVVGFLSHVQVDLKHKAEEAGCDHVMPRSAFTQRLAEILSGRF